MFLFCQENSFFIHWLITSCQLNEYHMLVHPFINRSNNKKMVAVVINGSNYEKGRNMMIFCNTKSLQGRLLNKRICAFVWWQHDLVLLMVYFFHHFPYYIFLDCVFFSPQLACIKIFKFFVGKII